MGNEVPCCASGKHDAKLLDAALKKGNQLSQDIRLAKHNRLVNGNSLSTMFTKSPTTVNISEVTLRRSPKNKN